MARKAPRPASLNNFVKELLRVWGKEDRFDEYPDRIASHAITPDQVERLVNNVARPIYAAVNGEHPYPAPMTEPDRMNYMNILQKLGLTFSNLLTVSATRPDFRQFGPAVDTLIDNTTWEQLVMSGNYDRRPIAKMLEKLHPEGGHTTIEPRDLDKRMEWLLKQPFVHQDHLLDAGLLLDSAADIMVTPTEFLSARRQRRLLERIEMIVPCLVKWPLLGFRPKDKTARPLYVLVA